MGLEPLTSVIPGAALLPIELTMEQVIELVCYKPVKG